MNKDQLREAFRKEVHDRAAEIDPESERYWLDLTYGWALGKGVDPDEALKFALHIRYETDLG